MRLATAYAILKIALDACGFKRIDQTGSVA